jgi:hypothetical protein
VSSSASLLESPAAFVIDTVHLYLRLPTAGGFAIKAGILGNSSSRLLLLLLPSGGLREFYSGFLGGFPPLQSYSCTG